MNIWLKAGLIGIAAVTLAFLSFWFLPAWKKGLVPRTSFTIHYLLQVTPDDTSKNNIMPIALDRISRRLDASGHPYKIKSDGERTLDINIRDVAADDTLFYIDNILTSNNKLEFRELYYTDELPLLVKKINEIALTHEPPDTQSSETPDYRPDTNTKKNITLKEFDANEATKETVDPVAKKLTSLIQFTIGTISGPGNRRYATIGYVLLKDTALTSSILNDTAVHKLFPVDAQFHYGQIDGNQKDNPYEGLYMIRTRGQEKAILSNEDILSSIVDQQGKYPEISFQFTAHGSRKWAKMTAENVDRPLAILYDDQVISAPYVSGPIEGGQVSLSGYLTVRELQAISLQLNSKKIPATNTILKKEISKDKVTTVRILLFGIIVFIVAAVTSFVIFKMLKNK